MPLALKRRPRIKPSLRDEENIRAMRKDVGNDDEENIRAMRKDVGNDKDAILSHVFRRRLYAMRNSRQKLKAMLTLLGLITIAPIAHAQAGEFPELGVVPRNGGFRMEGYWVWCGSVIKGDDGRYHMFASRWPKDITFHPGWMTNSEIVRAVADRPEGPYVFQQVVLPARGADYWDGRSTHNPSITRHGFANMTMSFNVAIPLVHH